MADGFFQWKADYFQQKASQQKPRKIWVNSLFLNLFGAFYFAFLSSVSINLPEQLKFLDLSG